MGVQGSVREQRDFSKETGLFEGKVLAFNPSKEQLEKLLNTTVDKEPEYTGEDAGVKKASLVVWLQDVKSKKIKPLRFFLKDIEKVNKDGTKKQYITNVGDASWADSEENLPDWFKKRPYRVAKEGEEALYKFAIDWLSKLDRKDEKSSLEFDWKELIKGNARELSKLIGSEFEESVVVLNTVRVVESGGEKKEYEQVYNQAFLPGYTMKYIRSTKIDDVFVEVAKKADRKSRSRLQNFVLAVKDPQYGVKDYFTLGELETYDASKNIASSDKVISDEDASY
jgi:hypothetical protein